MMKNNISDTIFSNQKYDVEKINTKLDIKKYLSISKDGSVN